MAFCIGLTGGIGCGKSTVAQLFAELGVTIIDTDAVSHALSQPGSAGFDAIIQRFGSGFRQADGTLDRAKLRTLVFSDADAKQALESILHPMIYAKVLEAISLCPAPYVIIVVPLLFETAQYQALIQRAGIPGGVCEFDVPSYHYWLSIKPEIRSENLREWMAPFDPLNSAIEIILKILRESGQPTRQIAPQGAYQQMASGRLAQMLRVSLDEDLPCFPEISANKYAINIRFTALGGVARPKVCDTQVDFSLTLCCL